MNRSGTAVSAFGVFSIYMRLIFTKVVHYLEVCALPYLTGIACAVGLSLQFPPHVWDVLSKIGVLGTVFILYSPVVVLHTAFVLYQKKKQPSASVAFFLEDSLTEQKFTTYLAILAAAVSLVFGIINYNFAVDVSHPEHVGKHVVKPWENNEIDLKGKIIREPEFRDFNVWLYVQPDYIGEERVSQGLVLVKVSRMVEGFEEYEYGQFIRVKGALKEPEPSTNPGTFNYKRHLNNRNIFGMMNVNKAENITGLGERESNVMFDASLWVKNKFLAVMKQTLPYPHSAFQGGIIYGLKTGLPQEQHFEFKWAGMAWILVVAGAHLLMVYLTLKMILETIRPNPKVAFLILFVLLIMFLILTGINPPTVRAFIMIMLYEFTRTFLGQDIRGAVRSAIGIAAFLLLASHVFPYFSPLMIFDPTVTLSFGAVLSLVYLSRPIEHVLRRYCYGVTSVVVLVGFGVTLTLMSVLRPQTLSLLGAQLLPVMIVTLIAAVLTSRFNDKYRDQYHLEQVHLGYNDISRFSGWRKWIHPTFFTYNNLPRWVLGFVGAQLAIQFGMVLPLSSWYFQRSPVGGLLANIIAFPTLGVVIQVGLVAVLIGMIPVIGLPLAFILNAADYLGIELMMKLAYWSKLLFPYPMAMKPTGLQLLLYYGILIGFVVFDRMFYSFDKRGYLTVREMFEQRFTLTKSAFYGRLRNIVNTQGREWALIGMTVVVLGAAGCYMSRGMEMDHLRVLVMELDDGSGTIIETPGGSRFLVDAGKMDWRGTFDVGERTISPVLLGQQIEHIDGVFMSSLKTENLGGMHFILDNFTISRVYVPFDPSFLNSEDTFDALKLEALGGRVTGKRGDQSLVDGIDRIRKVIIRRRIPVVQLEAGMKIMKDGGPVQIEVLNPPPHRLRDIDNEMANNSLVMRVTCGPTSVLLAGDVEEEGTASLVEKYGDSGLLRSTFVLIPSHGRSAASREEFVKAVSPKYAAVQYRRPPFGRSGSDKMTEVLQRYADAGARIFRTDLNGAIVVDAWPDGRVEVNPTLQTAIPDIEETSEGESGSDVQERTLLKSEGTGL